MVAEPREDVMPVIHLSVRISKPIDEVWEEFLDPVIMTQWLGNEISADMSEGGVVRFSGENAPTNSEIENRWHLKKYREPRAILFSWGILGVDTLFVLRFVPIPTGTLMDVKHGAIPEAAKQLCLADHWNILMANFKSVVELSEPALRFNYTNYHPLRTTRYDPEEVRVSILIKAPRILVFDVWTNPEKLKHFVRAEKPQVHKQYAGLYTWWAEGKGPLIFHKLKQDEEIEFTWVYGDEFETKINIRFEDVEGNTLVSLHHFGFREPEDVIGYDVAWTSILAELKLVCELGESGIQRMIEWK